MRNLTTAELKNVSGGSTIIGNGGNGGGSTVALNGNNLSNVANNGSSNGSLTAKKVVIIRS